MLNKTEELLYQFNDEPPQFASEDREFTVTLRDETWEDMGRPGEVTVTVVPGDVLNGVAG